MKIGVFDSGIGGLSVLHCARRLMPQADFIYYADEKHVPYGEKKPEEIRAFLIEILHFMLKKQVDAIVIACNTATSVLTMEYRNQFPIPIIGMEPAVKKAVDLNIEDKRILVAATPITIQGNKLNNLLLRCDTNQEVDLIALPGLVRYAEKGDFTNPEIETYLRNQLNGFHLDDYGTFVLGCTHFNYFKEYFFKIFHGKISCIDGNEGTVHQLIRVLSKRNQQQQESSTKNNGLHKGTVEYYFSGNPTSEKDRMRIRHYLEQLDYVDALN